MPRSRRANATEPAAPPVHPSGAGPRKPEAWKDVLWILALTLAAAFYFWPMLFSGQSIALRDNFSYFFPQAQITRTALLEGRLPHWVPEIGGGYPFQAHPHSMVFYPPALLTLPSLPPVRAFNALIFIHFPLGGAGLYLLLRRWGVGRCAAAGGAFTLQFCGLTISMTNLVTVLYGLAWTPWVMLAYDAWLGGRSALKLAFLTLAIAAEGSGTDPQYVAFSVGCAALTPWMRPGRGAGGRPLWGLAAASGLAAMLLAYQFVPLAELLSQSDRVAWSRSMAPDTALPFDLANVWNVLVANPFPDPCSPEFPLSFHAGREPFYFDLYWGASVLAFAFAGLGWVSGRTTPGASTEYRGAVLICASVIVLSAILALGEQTPIHGWLRELVPHLRAVRFPAKFLSPAVFAMAMLVALGIEGVRVGQRPCLKAFNLAGAGLALLLLLALILVKAAGDAVPAAFFAGEQTLTGDLPALYAKFTASVAANLLGELALLVAVLLVFRFQDRVGPRRTWLVGGIGLLALGNMAVTTRLGLATDSDVVLAGRPPATSALPEPSKGAPPPRFHHWTSPGVLDTGSSLTMCQKLLIGAQLLADLRGPVHGWNPVVGSGSVRLAGWSELQSYLLSGSIDAMPRVAAAMGATHALVGGLNGERRTVDCRRLPSPSPRAFIAPRAQAVIAGTAAPTLEAILAMPESVSFEEGAAGDQVARELTPAAIRFCRIVEYRPDSVRIEFDLEGTGLLVLLDSHYPGWKAEVDGHPRPIVRVNGLVRGVAVRGGERTVVMTYDPIAFRKGAKVSLAALGVVAILLVFSLARRVVGGRDSVRAGADEGQR